MAWTGSPSDYEAFVDRHGLTFPNLDDSPGEIFGRFGIPGQPAFAIVKPDGSGEVLIGAAGPELIDMIISGALD